MRYQYEIRKMKRLSIILIILCSGCAAHFGQDWTKADTVRQAAGTALHAVDWGQTLDIVKHSDSFNEKSPFLGSRPSVQAVNWHFASRLILQSVIPPMLKPRYRKLYQIGWIGYEAYWVGNNFSIGLKINF